MSKTSMLSMKEEIASAASTFIEKIAKDFIGRQIDILHTECLAFEDRAAWRVIIDFEVKKESAVTENDRS